jgi:hypothetical protein
MRTLTLCLILLGCTNPNANHIGTPLLLPVGVLTTGIQNAGYNARRSRVKSYIIANREQLLADVIVGKGPTLTNLMQIAKTPQGKQAALLTELRRGQTQYFAKDPEPLVVAIMVHS